MTNGNSGGDARLDDGDGRRAGALMLGYCRGEREAFDRLYAQVAPSIFAELLSSTGDRQRAEALLDRTFRALHERRSTYVAGADPRPWILQLALSELRLERGGGSSEPRRPLWSRVRTAFTRGAAVGLEA